MLFLSYSLSDKDHGVRASFFIFGSFIPSSRVFTYGKYLTILAIFTIQSEKQNSMKLRVSKVSMTCAKEGQSGDSQKGGRLGDWERGVKV